MCTRILSQLINLVWTTQFSLFARFPATGAWLRPPRTRVRGRPVALFSQSALTRADSVASCATDIIVQIRNRLNRTEMSPRHSVRQFIFTYFICMWAVSDKDTVAVIYFCRLSSITQLPFGAAETAAMSNFRILRRLVVLYLVGGLILMC